MTDEARELREKLVKFSEKHGIKSVRQLCILSGIHESNLYTNINGTYGMSVSRLFKIANTAKCDILEVLELFYPELVQQNREASQSKCQ